MVVFSAYLLSILVATIFLASDLYLLKKAYHEYETTRSEASLKSISSKIEMLSGSMQDPLWKFILNKLFDVKNEDISEFSRMAEFLPIIKNSEAPKRYLIVFQNSAEARGTGGIIGAFAEIEILNGKISLIKSGSNLLLNSQEDLPISMPDEYVKLYGSDPAIWQNSNISPNYPYAVRIWSALWEKQYNEKIDGVISTDPIALSYLLSATGPIKLKSGEIIDSKNVVEKTLSTAYVRFENQNYLRKEYLVEIFRAAYQKLAEEDYSKLGAIKAVIKSLHENRILIGFNDNDLERKILNSRISGNLNFSNSNEFRSVVINTSGNKLDYYLDRRIKLETTSCGKHINIKMSLTLTNTVPKGSNLPSYVQGRLDLKKVEGLAGRHGLTLLIYGPKNFEFTSILRSQSEDSSVEFAEELRRPIALFRVDLAASESETFLIKGVATNGKITYFSQPLVKAEKIAILDRC